MGCNTYSANYPVGNGQWAEAGIALPYADDDIPCVCTFPHNNQLEPDGLVRLEAGEARSLAYIGAMVVALHNGFLKPLPSTSTRYITPDDLPPGTREAIDAAVPA